MLVDSSTDVSSGAKSTSTSSTDISTSARQNPHQQQSLRHEPISPVQGGGIDSVLERYDVLIRTLSRSVEEQRREIVELKAALVNATSQGQKQVPHRADAAEGVESFEACVARIIHERLGAHFHELDERLARAMTERLARVTKEHVSKSIDHALHSLLRPAGGFGEEASESRGSGKGVHDEHEGHDVARFPNPLSEEIANLRQSLFLASRRHRPREQHHRHDKTTALRRNEGTEAWVEAEGLRRSIAKERHVAGLSSLQLSRHRAPASRPSLDVPRQTIAVRTGLKDQMDSLKQCLADIERSLL